MKNIARLAIMIGVAGVISGLSMAPATAAAPVMVKQCSILPPKPLSKKAGGTAIDYIIYGKKPAAQITFAVGYRNAAQHFLRTVTDYGTFSPGQQINHHFSLYNDVTYAGNQVTSCVPVKVKWQDSTLWVAPSSH
jgi:hypothetical protein